jgi:AcrR family transcriptional regulator
MRKRPTQQRSRQLVKDIIEAASRVIAEEGLDALTTNRVAEVAGISIGSLYQYFHDSADLLEEVLVTVSRERMAVLDQQLRSINVQDYSIRELAYMGLVSNFRYMCNSPLDLTLIQNWNRLPIHRLFDPLEQYMLNVSRTYFLQRTKSQQPPDLETRLYVLFNSTVFTLARFMTQDNPMMKEEAVLNCLADNIAMSLDWQGRD